MSEEARKTGKADSGWKSTGSISRVPQMWTTMANPTSYGMLLTNRAYPHFLGIVLPPFYPAQNTVPLQEPLCTKRYIPTHDHWSWSHHSHQSSNTSAQRAHITPHTLHHHPLHTVTKHHITNNTCKPPTLC